MSTSFSKNLKSPPNTPIAAHIGDKESITPLHIETVPTLDLAGKIHTLRGVQVMLDRDLAELYGTTPKRLRQQVKRNSARFPIDFMFQINEVELKTMGSQNVTPPKSHFGGTMPYVFTEQGVASLSGVLTNPRAVDVFVAIMRAFVEMRRLFHAHSGMFQLLDGIERRQLAFETETDRKFEQVFNALEGPNATPREGIFYDGRVYDAHAFVSDLIRSAKCSIVLIDNYLDDTVLTLLRKRNEGVIVCLYTRLLTPEFALDLKKHNAQYPPIQIPQFPLTIDPKMLKNNEI